jgi:hypothetical protein
MTKRNSKKRQSLPQVGVLILHGGSIDLVNYLISLLGSINITANNVLNLPSGKMNQESKVEYYLKNCGLPLVLVTFDEDNPTSQRARPNVYDEIARCRSLRREEALILQERRSSVLVELPSNVVGHLVMVQFDRDRFYLAIPQILNEICSRGLIATFRSSETTLEAGSILNDFMDKMDKLWDEQFDIAWKKIHRRDYDAERNFAEVLDLFFQQYHLVVDALVRKHKRGNELEAICDNAYGESMVYAARAWDYVAEAKLKKADQEMDRANEAKVLKYEGLYEQASDKLRSAKSSTSSTEKIRLFTSVVELVDEYLNKLRR